MLKRLTAFLGFLDSMHQAYRGVNIKKDIFQIVQVIGNGDVFGAVVKLAKMAAQLLIIVSIFFLAISIPDYFVQKRDFMEEMKMTKQEQKEEYKEMEGEYSRGAFFKLYCIYYTIF